MSKTAIKQCNCLNKYQDKKYGSKNRVHNQTAKIMGGVPIYRCTNCMVERV